MSAKRKKVTKTFNYTPQQPLPKLKKTQERWDLVGLFYKSPTDTTLQRDVAVAEKRYQAFAKKHSNKKFLKSDTALLASLSEYRVLSDTNLDRVFVYLFLCRESDASDTAAERAINTLQQRVTAFANEIIFYELALGSLPVTKQKQLLKNQKFTLYHFMLERIFRSARHQLSEAEERILSLKAMPARNLWIAGTDKIVNNATVKVGKQELPLNGALMEILDAPKARRHKLWQACAAKLKEIGPIAENELNALYLDKKINDELRGYKKPYEATVHSFDSSMESLEALTEAVETEGYTLSRKFYRLKANLMGEKQLPYLDRDDFTIRLPELTYSDAVTICRDAFYSFNAIYGEIFDEMLQNGQVDVYPRTGKGGGAFSISSVNTPTMIMLNHSADFSSLRTLAHEMGHAIHAYRSKKQDILYQDHSTITAETASTLFEAIVAHHLAAQIPEKYRAAYLNGLITDKIGTMIMCIARYRAELDMHLHVRQHGAMTWQEMATCLSGHFKKYCGPAVAITADDALSFIAKTHYRRNFYQFTYSYGQIMSSLMFSRYLADSTYVKEIDAFLIAGEKAGVEAIYKEIGIDAANPATFVEGLNLLKSEINTFAKLAKKK
jgi:oligoendopeptidase F